MKSHIEQAQGIWIDCHDERGIFLSSSCFPTETRPEAATYPFSGIIKSHRLLVWGDVRMDSIGWYNYTDLRKTVRYSGLSVMLRIAAAVWTGLLDLAEANVLTLRRGSDKQNHLITQLAQGSELIQLDHIQVPLSDETGLSLSSVRAILTEPDTQNGRHLALGGRLLGRSHHLGWPLNHLGNYQRKEWLSTKPFFR